MEIISNIDIFRLRAVDLETDKLTPGCQAPPIVVGSMAEVLPDGTVRGEILHPKGTAYSTVVRYLDEGYTLVGANFAFDSACFAAENPEILPKLFKAYAEGRIIDVSIVQTLDAIYGGHLGLDPRTGEKLRNPATKQVSDRYALATVLDLLTGRTDAKEAAAWRTSYALLKDVPLTNWPSDASTYPVDDTCNTLTAVLAQIRGWTRGGVLEPNESGPARNFNNQAAQAETAFALSLGACHSLRTDRIRVERLAAKVEKQHAEAVERFKKCNWRRDDGPEDQIAVKKSVAIAYGVTGTCSRCEGGGKVRPLKVKACRGQKVGGRFEFPDLKKQLALSEVMQKAYARDLDIDDDAPTPPPPPVILVGDHSACGVCSGAGQVQYYGDPVTCKGADGGCDGTGLNLSTAPYLPRTDKGGIRADRDTLMESGDDELAVYGEDEFEKTRTTFIPYLRSGIYAPLKLRPNVLVESGRLSYEGSPFHQLSRSGGVRETICARHGMVLGSTDYEAGELCSLSQVCYWTIGYSGMRDAINASGKPGILHSELAASVIGISIEEFLARLKAKDKQCIDFRQASKPINFGTPGGMGSSKLVWTARKKNAGFTPSEYGPSMNEDGNRGYAGIRFCILVGGAKRCGAEKINEWKGNPTYPVCKACVEVVENVLRVAYFQRFPEIREYFKKVSSWIKDFGRVPCLAWNAQKGAVEILRWRGCDEQHFPAGANNGFQALLADIMKLAYRTMTRECYLGVKADGSPSPLAGCRLPVVMHDEPISELFATTAHLSGPRIGVIMEESGYALAPDVKWVAQTALSFYLSKKMEPCFDESNKLIPWTGR